MNKFGILVNNLGTNQLSYHLIKELNLLFSSELDIDISVFR